MYGNKNLPQVIIKSIKMMNHHRIALELLK